MACPFFMPVQKLENGTSPHAARLPLGCGWSGHCTAPGYEGETPSQEELSEFCNLGYAHGCARLPEERAWDSVRFAGRTVGSTKAGSGDRIQVKYVCERRHLPGEHGMLEFCLAEGRWLEPHRDRRVQRMAECFLESYFEKRKQREAMLAAS